MIDILIVGQGLAGTVLSFKLMTAGFEVLVIDERYERSASQVAAGVINPITGRRMVKTWLIDELLPEAKTTYKGLEEVLNTRFWYDYNVLKSLKTQEEENEWQLRSRYPENEKYCISSADTSTFEGKINHKSSFAELKGAARVDVPLLIETYKAWLLEKGVFQTLQMNYEELKIHPNHIEYGTIKARRIIFCEGARGEKNPFFDGLHFIIDKGECFLVKIPNANFDRIYKHHFSVIPLQNNYYWFGATDLWYAENDLPTEEKRLILYHELKEILQIPFEIIEHKAGFRPTVKDRRPYIGQSPKYENMYFFNGFGTKGTSLIPFAAEMLSQFLQGKREIMPEMDIKRLKKIEK